MSQQITITNITGAAPYDVYLCDNTYSGCIYIDTIYGYDIPYSFLVPSSFSTLVNVGVKVIDNNNCIIEDLISI